MNDTEGTEKVIIDNFVLKQHSDLLKNFYDKNTNLCSDGRDEHKHRNLHFVNIKDTEIQQILLYYQTKLKFFIDHFFNDCVKAWNDPQICRWKVGESMDLHGDDEDGAGKDSVKYSALTYLNDNYEGGELRFENGKLYKLKENSVIFFMSGVQNRHQVLEIKKGLRYTLPMWYN
tara:strand:+ start:313 stop:834 length:522 start_codon:yes stop_codon:yes gene_type:complete